MRSRRERLCRRTTWLIEGVGEVDKRVGWSGDRDRARVSSAVAGDGRDIDIADGPAIGGEVVPEGL